MREDSQQRVDELSDSKAALVREWLHDLRDANEEDGPSLNGKALASLGRGLADLTARRVTHLADYERERGL